jgi:hypothetical protein
MARRLRLTVFVGEALLLFILGYFVLELLLASLLKTPAGLSAVILVPISAATWWLFRKLRQIYSCREASAAAITFGVFSPISLLVATPLATLPGSLVAGLLGAPFGVVGAFLGLAVLTGVLILVPMALALWIARHVRTTGTREQGGPQ